MEKKESVQNRPDEIDDIRLTAGVTVFGSVAAIRRLFQELDHQTELRVIYRRTSGGHLRIVDAPARGDA